MAFVEDATVIPEEVEGGGENMLAAPPTVPGSEHPEHVQRLYRWSDPALTINLCDELIAMPDGEGLLGRIGQTAIRQYDIDETSRTEWKTKTKAAMDLAMQITGAKTSPWPGASNIVYPLVSAAAIQFAARAYPAIVAGKDVVKGVVVGDDKGEPVIDPQSGGQMADPETGQPMWLKYPGVKQARSERIGQHMSWQLLEDQPEWELETDKLLHILPIVGCIFRKSYFDPEEDRNVAVLVLADHLVINYRAKSLETAPRLTEIIKLYPVEIEESQRSGVFLEHDFGQATDGSGDEDAPHEFLEQHRRIDLDEDGYPEPYIVTVHKATAKVVRIVPRYDPEGIMLSGLDKQVRRISPIHYYTQYNFLPNPDGGIYGIGLGQLLDPINQSVNTTLNQMFDAASMQNSGGGFVGKGLSLHSGSLRFKLGEWKIVNALGSTVRDAVVPLTFQGPSPVLFQLLGFMIDAGKELSSNTEVLSGAQRQANVPATTTLALIEQGLKVFTAVYKRIYRSLKSEYDKQFRLNRIYLDRDTRYRYRDEWKVIQRQDYVDGSGVEPVSDPAMVSDMQQLAKAELLKGFLNDPLIDRKEVLTRIFAAVKLEDPEKLLKQEPDKNPELMLKSMEVALNTIKIRAAAINQMAQAIEHLAKSDVMVNEDFRSWIGTQLDIMKSSGESLDDEQQGAGAAGPRNQAGGVPVLAPPPGNAAVPQLPA